ncbi:MAG: hypothetical protein NC489_40670 [Ruminococcus flavefaciens]|nr:hypothetical protein [Ruminococcus flavefaciens]
MGKDNGDVSIDKVDEFYDWLQGKSCPKNMYFEQKLNLSEEQAFSVIYFLQEYLGVLPDKYERCRKCGRLYDSEKDGVCISEETEIFDMEKIEYVSADFPEEMYGLYCDNCRPDYITKPYPEWIKED